MCKFGNIIIVSLWAGCVQCFGVC